MKLKLLLVLLIALPLHTNASEPNGTCPDDILFAARIATNYLFENPNEPPNLDGHLASGPILVASSIPSNECRISEETAIYRGKTEIVLMDRNAIGRRSMNGENLPYIDISKVIYEGNDHISIHIGITVKRRTGDTLTTYGCWGTIFFRRYRDEWSFEK